MECTGHILGGIYVSLVACGDLAGLKRRCSDFWEGVGGLFIAGGL